MKPVDAKDLRMTPQRQAILEVVREARDHPSVAEIYRRVKERLPQIAYGTVYNAVGALSERGDLLELTFGDGASRYDGRTGRHDHARCTGCGKLADVESPVAGGTLAAAAQQSGFHLVDYHTEFYGLCPDCAARRSP